MSDGGAVRIVVDGSRCDGRGICALILPERISLDTWGYASVDSEPIDSPRALARARRAVNACPARALSLRNSDGAVQPIRRQIIRRPRNDAVGAKPETS